MKVVLALCICFYLADVIHSQLMFQGPCPNYDTEANFDLKKYLGIWYENERYFNLVEAGTKCNAAKIVTQKDGTTTFTGSVTRLMTGNRISKTGIVRELNGRNTTARLAVTFNTLPFLNQEIYQILATDYTNYSIIFSCRDLRVASLRKLWILTREKIPSNEVRGQIYAHLHKLGIRTLFLRKTEQENCPIQHDLPNTL